MILLPGENTYGARYIEAKPDTLSILNQLVVPGLSRSPCQGAPGDPADPDNFQIRNTVTAVVTAVVTATSATFWSFSLSA